MADLKPCPFCGGEAEYEEFNDGFFSWGRVECQCGVMLTTPPNVTIKAWNTRKPMEAVVAELEKLKGEYEHHCIHGAWQRGAIDGAKTTLSKAISIVRGKE